MRHLAVGGLLAGIVLALYSPVLSHGFVDYDDDVYIVDNSRLADGLTVENIRWAFTTPYHSNWHPLTWLSWFIDAELFGVSPTAFHRTDVLLHAGNAVLLYLLVFLALQRLTPLPTIKKDRSGAQQHGPHVALRSAAGAVPHNAAILPAALAALLFALHPLRVESVAWASERKDLLSAFFAFAATIAYIFYVRNQRWTRYAITTILFALALLAKPMAVTLPLLWLALDYWPLARFTNPFDTRRALLDKLPLLSVTALAAVVTLVVQHSSGAVRSFDDITWADRLVNVPVAYAIYLKQTFWPTNLAVFYPHPGENWSSFHLLTALALLAAVTSLVVLFRRKAPWLLTGWCWFVLALTPVIGFIQTGAQQHADRYTYLPHVGFALILAAAMATLLRQPIRLRVAAITAATATVALVLVGMTAQQITVWKSSRSLFAHALAVTQDNYIAHNNYGYAVRDDDDLTARQHFETALALRPDYYDARINLGTSYFLAGEFNTAIAHYLQAMQLDGARPDAFVNIGLTLARLERWDEAIEGYKQALNRAPGDPFARMYLADALLAQENWFHAAAQYDIVLQIAPHLDSARANRDIALANLETKP